MRRPLLLDLFCGAGGCAVGYHRAGFDVLGVDNVSQPRYPYSLIQDDAMEVLARLAARKAWRGYRARDFAAIHASPPCQRYSSTRNLPNARQDHPDLVRETAELLREVGRLYVIENVPAAPLSRWSITLCGLMFGLKVFRHRRFESSALLFQPPHASHGQRRIGRDGFCCVAGNGSTCTSAWNNGLRTPADHRTKAAWSLAMGIDWMTRKELAQAIPLAYTEFIGRQLLNAVNFPIADEAEPD